VDLGLKDATAVVAGGGRGMGLAAAPRLADDGARVAIVGRTEDVLEKAAKDLTVRGSPDALGVVADAGDAAAVQHVFDEIGERWNGELDERWPEAFDDGAMGMVHGTDFT
jgi:3-oxoacyl-[acyl-carrier protein] reductase